MKTVIALLFCSLLSAQKLAFVQDGRLWMKPAPEGVSRALVSSGDPHAPAFSPDGAWVAFLDANQLGVVACAGGEIYYPPGAQPVSRFRWSGAGPTLAMATEDSVYLTSEASAWRPSRIFAGDPGTMVFSPAGKQLAISSFESTQEGIPLHGKIEIIAVDGGTPARAIQTTGEWEQFLPFAWTGDTILAWKGEISGSAEADGFEVWANSTSGAPSGKLSGPVLVHPELHALSPDGKKLALTDGEGRQAWTRKKITVVDLETGKSNFLTATDTSALDPAWSPNGEAIAFIAGPDAGDVWGGEKARAALDARRLWIMDADGSHKRQLTSDANYRDEQPVWSADGKSLIFCRIGHDAQATVWSIAVESGEPRLLAGPLALNEDGWFGDYGYVDWSDRIAIYRSR